MAFKPSQVVIGNKIAITYPDADWVGFDLDGTLATYQPHDYENKGAYVFGDPIESTCKLAKELMANGCPVYVVTARHITYPASPSERQHNEDLQLAVSAWTFKNIGSALPVRSDKDGFMHVLIDDRALAVESNTGKILGGLRRLKGLIHRETYMDETRQTWAWMQKEIQPILDDLAQTGKLRQLKSPEALEQLKEELANSQINVLDKPPPPFNYGQTSEEILVGYAPPAANVEKFEKPLTCSEYVPIEKLSEPGFQMPEVKTLVPVKLSPELYAYAEIVAKNRGMSLSDLLSDWVTAALEDERHNDRIDAANKEKGINGETY